jgi:hypothetical protein
MRNRIEMHLEYLKDRTVIFTGAYMINHSQVSLMYIPVVNANTDMKIVGGLEVYLVIILHQLFWV